MKEKETEAVDTEAWGMIVSRSRLARKLLTWRDARMGCPRAAKSERDDLWQIRDGEESVRDTLWGGPERRCASISANVACGSRPRARGTVGKAP
jgi:hypothetical protein